MVPRYTTAVVLSIVGLALVACGKEEHPGLEEPAREGLAIPLEGIEYNVFITRQLNLSVPPDSAYYEGPEPPEGQTLYGVFLQACNQGGEPRQTTGEFTVRDNQGTEFEPIELPEENAFAYHPQELAPKECIPAKGSVAQLGPTAGSMLLFQLPLAATENRPLELEIFGGFNAAEGKREKRTVELDI
jgi:hypothetical protein